MAQLAALQAQATRWEHEESPAMKKAVQEELAAREVIVKKTTEANKALAKALEEAQRALEIAQNKAAENKRERDVANFAHNSVEKSLQHVRNELAEAREQLSRMKVHAKKVVEREQNHVQHLQRELASTKEMLRVSQKAHRGGKSNGIREAVNATGAKYGPGGADIIKAAREQIFVSLPPTVMLVLLSL